MTKRRNNKTRPAGGRKQNKNQNSLMNRLVSYEDQSRNRMEPSVPDVPRLALKAKKVYTTTLSLMLPNITGSSTVPTQGAIAVQLASFPDYVSWTNCFDAYRIIHIDVEFIPFGIGVTGTTQTNGTFYSCIDYDDATPIDFGTILQYDTRQIVPSGVYFERRFVPRAAVAMYSGVAFTSYGQSTSQWIDSSSPSVQHYGLKYYSTVSSSAVTLYTPIVTATISFRNSK